MGNLYTWEHIKKIRQYPHLLGHLCGKTKLTQMHSDWIRYAWEADKDVGLMGHRGSYKSTSIVEIGIIWKLLFDPNARIFLIRKTFTQSSSEIRTIAQMMQSDLVKPLLELAWGTKWKFSMLRDGALELSTKTRKTKEPNILALGLDSAIVSLHTDSVIILDDFIDINDRVSEAERERTKMIVREVRTNIIDPGGHCICCGTPWHKHDAWEDLEHPEDGGRGIEIRRYPVSSTGLLSPEEMVEKRAKTTPVLYSINYDLAFENEDDMLFRNPHMGTWHDDCTDIKAHIDAAFKGSHYCALSIMGRMPNGKFNVVGFTYPGNMKDWLPFVVGKVIKYGAKELFSESNADKGFSLDIIGLNPDIRRAGVWTTEYHETEKKHVKITNYLHDIYPMVEFAKESDAMYLEQIVDWREGSEPDDSADSLSSLAREGGYSSVSTFGGWGMWKM